MAASAQSSCQMDAIDIFRYKNIGASSHGGWLKVMSAVTPELFQALEVRLRGRVQGVGFRPKVWRMARELGLAGEVLNDAEGVLLRVGGEPARIAAFLDGIERELPPLARVDAIETRNSKARSLATFALPRAQAAEQRLKLRPTR